MLRGKFLINEKIDSQMFWGKLDGEKEKYLSHLS